MKKAIKKYSSKRQFKIHPLAYNAFDFYANLDNQFLMTCKPRAILAELNKNHALRYIMSDNTAYVFAGFSNQFFDLNNIDETTLLVEYRDISDADIARMAWVDVLTQVFSSKREVNARVDLFKAINQYLPDTPAIQSLFPDTKLVSLETFAPIVNVEKGTLQRNINRRHKT